MDISVHNITPTSKYTILLGIMNAYRVQSSFIVFFKFFKRFKLCIQIGREYCHKPLLVKLYIIRLDWTNLRGEM